MTRRPALDRVLIVVAVALLALAAVLALTGCRNADRSTGLRFTFLGLDVYGQEMVESSGDQTGRYVRRTPHSELDYTVDTVGPDPSPWTTHRSQCGPAR